MGVYIPGMEMPEPGRTYKIRFTKSNGAVIAGIAVLDSTAYRPIGEIVPVPLHGRLGDLDELLFKLPAPIEDEYKHVRRIVSGAPTIIPADKGG